MFQVFFQRAVRYRLFYFFVLFSRLLFAETGWGQEIRRTDEILRQRIEFNRQRIDTAGSWHATDVQLGKLWLQLAYDYGDELDVQRAEEAYDRALKLLRRTSAQKYYADALDGLGLLYNTTDRLKEAESCRRKALAIFEALGDDSGVARAHVGVAIILLYEQRFTTSEEESSEALRGMREQKQPDNGEFVAGLVASSYAKCFLGRCEEGLVEAKEAMIRARADFASDSVPVIVSLLAVGFEQWKTGAQAEGEKAMHEALELVHGNMNMPRRMLIDVQLKVFTRYADYLKATHQKMMAKQMEHEIERLRGEQTPLCRDCTVNVVALSANAR
jgi:tetratricopeptide (TPR) repeat protein